MSVCLRNAVLSFCVLLISNETVGRNNDVCLSLPRNSMNADPETIQGRPGKQGPKGSSGDKGVQGMKGEPGDVESCGCDPGEFKALKETIDQIQSMMTFLQSTEFLRLYCGVGIRNGVVKNEDLTASSSSTAGRGDHSAYNGRLDFKGNFNNAIIVGCWASGQVRIGEWIQVDLKTKTFVTGVITQGRGDGGYQQWVTSFKITYGDATSNMRTIKSVNGTDEIFVGNTDKSSYKLNKFPNPITARYIRLYPQTWSGWISLRLEYVTC